MTTTIKICLLMISVISFIGCKTQNEKSWTLTSPDGKIEFSISINDSSQQKSLLQYQVASIENGNTSLVIESSPLGIVREDQSFAENLSFVSKSEVKTIDEKYTMLIGRQTDIRNHANEFELTFKNEQGSEVQLVVRAYNDGVAFRYVFPGTSENKYKVTKELTGFKLPTNGKAWIQPYAKSTKWGPSYELYYENEMAIGTASPNTEGWGFPALFHSNKHWVLISEANLFANYCGVRLEQNAPEGLYKVRFPEAADALGTGNVEPTYTLPWVMPWRTIIMGTSPATIVESQMINNLSDPSNGDFSWVKPGRASWSWNTEHDSPKNYDALKRFVDLAAEMKWEYSLVDANWDLMKGGNIEQLVKYAASKNVGILMWYNSGGPHNEVAERPRDIMYDAKLRKEEFKKLNEWGVKGVKIDFWHSDKQNLITQYIDVMKDAAEHKIMVNFHGCTIPRGWSRTYPNLVTLESNKGEENYDFDSTYPVNAPVQNSILAFTRNVIGPMDYTPTTLTNLNNPHLTSFAHELALTIVFNSGILHFGDNDKSYRSMPEYAKAFVKNVPVTFDETRFISGEPGKSIILASRKGKVWYIAGINSENINKEMEITLPFIEKGESQMNIISDGTDAKSFANKMQAISSNQSFTISMLPYGGFVATCTMQ